MTTTIGNITEFDRPTARDMQSELRTVLQEFAAKRGLTLGDVRGNFNASSFVVKTEFLVDGAATRKQERKESSLEIYAKAYLPGVDLAKQYKHPTLGMVTIHGWNSRAREYPVQIKVVNGGKTYKMAIADVQKMVRFG